MSSNSNDTPASMWPNSSRCSPTDRLTNWPRRLLRWGFIAALLTFPRLVDAMTSSPKTTPTQFVVILPWPPKELKANRSSMGFLYREAKRIYAGQAMAKINNVYVAQWPQRPRWKKAQYSIRAILGKSRSGKNQQTDEDNLLSALKHAFDQLQTVGIIENDRGLSIAKPVEWIKTNAKESLVELTVWEVEHE